MGKVLHASYSGWFPFCLSPYDLGNIFPVYTPIELKPAMRIWWVIKKFRLYGTYVIDPYGPEREERSWEIVVERNSVNEEGLVCNPAPGWIVISQTNVIGAAFNISRIYTEGGLLVVESAFSGDFQDGAQEQGISYTSIYNDVFRTYGFEGLTYYMTGDNNTYYEFTTINHQILKYYTYGGTYKES